MNIHSNQKTVGAGSAEPGRERESAAGFITWWQGSFGSEENVEHRRAYENHLESGRAILRAAVLDELVDSAVDLLNRHGAMAIEHMEQSGPRAEPRGGVRVYNQNSRVGGTGRPATGMSPRRPSSSPLSGFGTTPGTGTLAGETTTGLHDQDFTPEYRQNFEKLFRMEAGPEFDSMRPAYEFGYRSARDKAYSGRSWNEVEKDIRARWERENPPFDWDRAKIAIRKGWDYRE